MTKNPFEIFGLTPEMVADLTEKELFSVLKSLYRALQKALHPDVAGRRRRAAGPQRAVELNLAFEALNLDKDPVAFRRHRKNFVARRPRAAYQKSLVLERQLAAQAAREERLADAYLNRLIADYGWPEAPGEVKADALVPAPVDFPLRNVRLGLLDVAINQNLKMVSWSVGSNYKEMKFDAEGGLTVRPVGRTRFSRASYIHLIGAVSAAELDVLPYLEKPSSRFFKAPALNASIGANGPSLSVLNRIAPEQFKAHVLAFLRPQVTERSYLFSLNKPEFEDSGRLTLEGLVVKIERL